MLSLITVFAMIQAEVGSGTRGRSWMMESMCSRTRSNTGSSVRLRKLEDSDDSLIKTRRRRRSGGYSVYTSGRGGLPDLTSFSSKLARIGDIFSHQEGPDVWREMFKKSLSSIFHPPPPSVPRLRGDSQLTLHRPT